MKSIVLSVSSFALLGLMGCSATVSGGSGAFPDLPNLPTGSGSEKPHVVPSTCENLTGKYQMNADYFNLKQPDCKELTQEVETFTSSGIKVNTYVFKADGSERLVSETSTVKTYEKSYFTETKFIVEKRSVSSSGEESRKQVYYLSAKPCNLMNPSGMYLARETFVNGSTSGSCTFWAKR